MADVSVSALMVGARLYADRRASGADAFVTDTEATSMVHRSIIRLRNKIQLAAGHELYVSTSSVTATGATQYALPTDYQSTLSVRVKRGNEYEPVRAIEQREVPDAKTAASFDLQRGYRLALSTIDFVPAPPTGATIEHVYVQRYNTSTTTLDLWVDGWDEWVMLDVAYMILRTGREPADDVARDRDALGEQIETLMQSRSPDPIRIVDVERPRHWWPGEAP